MSNVFRNGHTPVSGNGPHFATQFRCVKPARTAAIHCTPPEPNRRNTLQ